MTTRRNLPATDPDRHRPAASAPTTAGSQALTRRSLADQMADKLIEMILADGLRHGDPLAPTAELAGRFDVSRTVVREALATLTGQGILSRSQGRECVVATPGLADLTRLLRFRIRHDNVGPQEILQVRLALEVTAAGAAARVRDGDDIASMRGLLSELAAARDDADFHRTDIALHRAVAVAAHNPLLTLILDALVDFLHEVRVQATHERRARGLGADEVVDDHRKIVDAVAAGDAPGAEAAMRDHLERTRSAFRRRTGAR